jgi:hypothetical protein
MSIKIASVVAAGLVSLLVAGPGRTAVASGLRIHTTSVAMEYVQIETDTPYSVVVGRLESEVKPFGDHYRTLLAANNIEQLRQELVRDYPPSGFMIHFVAAQGQWLALQGQPAQGKVYYIGNVLSASQMTRFDFAAALCAPLRLNVYANPQGGTTFEYDLPSTQFLQFRKPGIDKVAKQLDRRLFTLISMVSR